MAARPPPAVPEQAAPPPEEHPPAAPQRGGVGADLVNELYTDWADRLETKLNTASENGLFLLKDEEGYNNILNPLMKAIGILAPLVSASKQGLPVNLSPAQYEEARRNVNNAQHLFDRAVNAIGLWRRLLYIYGFFTWLYLILATVGISWVLIRYAPSISGSVLFPSVPIQALLSGSLGGILRGGMALWYDVNRGEYRKVWATWFLLTPIMGALLGGAVYLAFIVGIVATTQTVNFTNPQVSYLLAFIAGFNWEWAVDVLDKVAKGLGKKE